LLLPHAQHRDQRFVDSPLLLRRESEIDKLGTNLLTVTNGQTAFGQTAELTEAAPGMISRIGPVTTVQSTGVVTAKVYRSPLIPAIRTNALTVLASTTDLPATVGTTLAAGRYQQWFYVVGILNPAVLAPEIDSAMLVGFPAAETYLGFDRHPSTIYLRARTDQVAAVRQVPSARLQRRFMRRRKAGQSSSAIAWGGGLGAALLIGAVAGLLPALRAARMSPTRALWSV